MKRFFFIFGLKIGGLLGRSSLLLVMSAGLTSCSHFKPHPSAVYVYVTAKQTYLRDRTAAVSNRTAMVSNGQRLRVLETSRHWLHVTTDNAETGWIDDKVVTNQQIYDQFTALHTQHQKDPSVAQATVHDEVNLHVSPGRDTQHFFRLAEGDKLQLLQRAAIQKPGGPAKPQAATATAASSKAAAVAVAPEPPPMEDWWLVRNAKGEAGWILSRMMDVETPDALVRYSEGQRMVGSYVLTTINDPDAPQDIKDVPVYVAVFSPYKAGLTYDFDQVRVFTWNRAKHRYETGFREHNIEGYLPITIGTAKDPGGKGQLAGVDLPTFSYRVLSGDAPVVVPDPTTGVIAPGATLTKTYRLEGNLVRRLDPPANTPVNEAHPAPPEKKKEPTKKRHR